jgi:hypothetical protein
MERDGIKRWQAAKISKSLQPNLGYPRRMMDNWYHPLAIGQPLPTLPIWLTETWAISLDLETSYEETCRTLRIR